MSADFKRFVTSGAARSAVKALLVTLAYYAGAQIGFRLKFASIPTSIFWLPNATMFAVFLLAPTSRWWLYALAALPAHAAVQLPHHAPPMTMSLLFASNLADGALAAFAIRKFSRGRAPFEGFREVALFLLFAVAAPFVVSFADAAAVTTTGWARDFSLVWHTRFRSNVLTNIIWVPAVVIGVTRGADWLRTAPRRALVEAAALALGLGTVAVAVFGPGAPHTVTVLLLVPFPLFLWAAVRFGPGGVSAALLGFAFIVIWSVAHGNGPFTPAPPLQAALPIQLFLTLLSAPMLLLAALLQERRQMEAALAERESQYRSIVESTGDGVLVTDLDNAVVAVNPAFCTIAGYRQDELVSLHPPRDFLHLDDLQPFDSYLARTATTEVVTTGLMCVCADGRLTRLELRGKRFSYGGRVHVLSIVRDMTEREQSLRLLEQKVAERTRELSTLLEISNTVASNLELKPLLRVVLEQLQLVLGCTGVTIFVVEGEELVVLDHCGPLAAETIASTRLPGRQMIACAQERNGSPVIVGNLWGDGELARAFRDLVPEALTTMLMSARSVLLVPLRVRERTIGFLLLDSEQSDRYDTRDGTLAWALANQAAVAIENARLYDQARELAAFEERQRLARDLHDSVTQSLYTASMIGRMLPGTWESDPPQGRTLLAHLGEVTEAALAEMRTLLLELRPAAILQSGLDELLRRLVQALRSHVEKPIEVEIDGSAMLPPDVHLAFYRLAQAALGNVVRHVSSAQARVQLALAPDQATLVIHDDGGGFDVGRLGERRGMGVDIMRERAEAIGARFQIESVVGQGTTVSLRWPA
ncbi:MAG TPA: MASE1 domain-containing protein [Polyangia bacterium]|jgi:PAS domain S-box-containing protein